MQFNKTTEQDLLYNYLEKMSVSEFAEDSTQKGWGDLQKHNLNSNDVVIGIAASRTTPYVISAIGNV